MSAQPGALAADHAAGDADDQALERADFDTYIGTLGARARAAARALSAADSGRKNAALEAAAAAIDADRDALLAANRRDLDAGRGRLDAALLDRLELTPARLATLTDGLRQIAALPDPVGALDGLHTRPSGIQVGRMRVPLGVIGIIYESRPNVTADAAGLCLKAGNAAILRGGSEAIHSNRALAAPIRAALETAGLPADAVQLVDTTDRGAVGALLRAERYIDVIIPRGGKNLIRRVSADARVPVIKHLDGNCHVYVDERADLDKALAVAYNAKCRRYGICGAMETLLVHAAIAERLLPPLTARYRDAGVELRGCERTRALVDFAVPASDADWDEEFHGPVLAIGIVDDFDQAIDHIERHGSHHTDAIVTEDFSRARRFLREVDSSSVMVNASTQFADGYEYGLGAEIGISTDRLHVRGPVGLEGLTTQKYVVLGDGHARA